MSDAGHTGVKPQIRNGGLIRPSTHDQLFAAKSLYAEPRGFSFFYAISMCSLTTAKASGL